MKKYILLLLLVVGSVLNAQTVNNFKAVIVPLKFDFLKSENAYRLNTISKFNTKKAGFEAFYANQSIPKEMNNRCDLLYLNVEKESGFLVTKLLVTFKDCNGNVVFQSEVGRSKEKDFEAAYMEALNEAFQSVYALHYKYEGPAANVTSNDVDQNQTYSNNQTVYAPSTKVNVQEVEETKATTITATEGLLYAQPIANGYQLIDATPKVVMKVTKTSNSSTYIAVKGDTQGVLVSKNGTWYFEYYKDQNLISEKVEVKF
ncbi:hypothetical protein [Flavobacterium frigidarium]|uniref:hypothetical protein n=1 Tax=Flavobacterium frigidarium TaxID=99286 RepID=UPI0030DCE93D|tara:strand:+ start:1652 stop:2428 length:777 start_codon:yes stop_codon:yes gene_type:complete